MADDDGIRIWESERDRRSVLQDRRPDPTDRPTGVAASVISRFDGGGGTDELTERGTETDDGAV